ncbi:uncharacterized protein BJ171DRAFT_621688 [Polychytrium aggregatum]|uniref:uncharacterized protein n=1 Tax=Polychytrium aggregatum TaxID=110093 RepID=UPI0022FE4962|nr:uncharacterized protein BJ171DRAFT_621688 [Polychytrium aggregatum]KAI9188617.1 hypothetical protein BJ171DRAFT_621688 [Polychytrium aggregatum]
MSKNETTPGFPMKGLILPASVILPKKDRYAPAIHALIDNEAHFNITFEMINPYILRRDQGLRTGHPVFTGFVWCTEHLALARRYIFFILRGFVRYEARVLRSFPGLAGLGRTAEALIKKNKVYDRRSTLTKETCHHYDLFGSHTDLAAFFAIYTALVCPFDSAECARIAPFFSLHSRSERRLCTRFGVPNTFERLRAHAVRGCTIPSISIDNSRAYPYFISFPDYLRLVVDCDFKVLRDIDTDDDFLRSKYPELDTPAPVAPTEAQVDTPDTEVDLTESVPEPDENSGTVDPVESIVQPIPATPTEAPSDQGDDLASEELDEDTIVVDQDDHAMEDVAVVAEPTVTPTAVSSKDATVSLKRKRDVQDRAEDDSYIVPVLVSAIPSDEKSLLHEQFWEGRQKLLAMKTLESLGRASNGNHETIQFLAQSILVLVNGQSPPVADTQPKPAAPVIEELPDERWSFQKLDVAALKAAFAEPVDPNPANFKTVRQLIDADAGLKEYFGISANGSKFDLLARIVSVWFEELLVTAGVSIATWRSNISQIRGAVVTGYISQLHPFIVVIAHLFIFDATTTNTFLAMKAKYGARLVI